MKKSQLVISPHFTLGRTDGKLFGSFIEHLGRAVYGGIYEPGHPRADADGFRGDVAALIEELNVPLVRYPGGNFVSGYNWEDGVGPVERRPARMELAWKSVEPNLFGTNEFVRWCRVVGAEPLMAVNLGTRGPDDARRLVEYCNHPGGTALSDLRRAHGYDKPHGIKYWCLGNEQDGAWQMGHKTASEYARAACEAARLMKLCDPTIKLVFCGSSNMDMPTFGEWEYTVLNECYELVDYISLHQYFGNSSGDSADFLAGAVRLDDYIKAVVGICDSVKAAKRSAHTVLLSVDEWNVWYHSNGAEFEEWSTAPRILEDIYTFEDAVAVGSALITLMKNCGRVGIACIAQLVNVIAPIMTDDGGAAWRQTTFFPFAQASNFGRGTVLDSRLSCDTLSRTRLGTPVGCVDCVCVLNDAETELSIFAVNRDMDSPNEICVKLSDFTVDKIISHSVMSGYDKFAVNSRDSEDVRPADAPLPELVDGRMCVKLNPLSWNMLRISLK